MEASVIQAMPTGRIILTILALWISYWLAAVPAAARTLNATPGDYRMKLQKLLPGDTLVLAPGEYLRGLPIHRINGTAGNPISITGPRAEPAAVFLASPGHNTVSVLDSSFVNVSNLVLDGRGIPVDGVKCEGHAKYAHHITLDSLTIVRHGANQQTVGISTKCPAWNWTIRGNTIIGAGTGIYLGNANGAAPFFAGLIERNLVRDTIGYNMQIKHQAARPLLSGMPLGDSVTVIRDNVFSKADNAGVEAPRPNLLVGHWPLSGYGSDDMYLIYRNFFYQNPTESLFQGEGRLAFYTNVMVTDGKDGVRIQPHNDHPRDIRVLYNTIVAAGIGISFLQREEHSPERLVVAGNAVFGAPAMSGLPDDANYLASYERTADYVVAARPDSGRLDMHLLNRTEFDSGFLAQPTLDLPSIAFDFGGRERDPDTYGAYASTGNATNDWQITLEIKPESLRP